MAYKHFDIDDPQESSTLLEALQTLQRGNRVWIGNELYDFIEIDFDSHDNCLLFCFFKVAEKPKIAMPYWYVLKARSTAIEFYKLIDGEKQFIPTLGKRIEFIEDGDYGNGS